MEPSAGCGAQCAAWCAAGAIVWLCVVVRFVLQRWQSVAMGVRANIDRFNAIDAERRDRDAAELVRRSGGCYRCLVVPSESATNRPGKLNISGSTVTESDTDPPPPAATTSDEQRSNGNGTPPAVVSSTRRRLISITRNHSIDPPSRAASTAAVAAVKSGDMKIFEICRTRSIVSRLAKRFENNNGLERSVSSGSVNNATHHEADESAAMASSPPAPPATENFFVFEKTDVFAVPVDTQPSFGQIADAGDEAPSSASSPTMSSSISPAEDDFGAEPDDNWLRRSMDDILEECQRTDHEVQMRRRSFEDAANRQSAGVGVGAVVRTFDEVMRQERFSKCYSEYSISDLLKELADDGDGEADEELADADLACMLARIQ